MFNHGAPAPDFSVKAAATPAAAVRRLELKVELPHSSLSPSPLPSVPPAPVRSGGCFPGWAGGGDNRQFSILWHGGERLRKLIILEYEREKGASELYCWTASISCLRQWSRQA